MERTLEIRTGESIDIRYELAGLGSRFLAVGVDLAIQITVTIMFILVLSVVSARFGLAAGNPAPEPALSKSGRAILEAGGVLAVFVLYFGYFIIFELWWSGRTPGKRALGLRVVRDAGFPIDIGAAVVRNLVRVLEFSCGFYALSAVAALLSSRNKRLGDMAAGTIVVRDRRYEAASLDAYLARTTALDDGLPVAERNLIDRYVARRTGLEPNARDLLAATIARRIRPQLRATFDHLTDDELLEHLGRSRQP